MSSSPAVSQIGTGSTPGRVLAIDYGRKRLGLAVSDPLGLTARPLATWTRSNRRHDLARLRTLCREQEISRIVVGLPLQLGGATGEMASEAARFAERIRKEAGIPTAAVGLITQPMQANEIILKGQADIVLLAREMLRDPYWPVHAAAVLGENASWPVQYLRAAPQGSSARNPVQRPEKH